MAKPEGSLTSAQHEIMAVVWDRGDQGATVSEIWQAIVALRRVGRTTILNLVDRLERRGWLVRRDREKPCHYLAALGGGNGRRAGRRLCGRFLRRLGQQPGDEPAGAKRLRPSEIERLRALLEATSPQSREKGGNSHVQPGDNDAARHGGDVSG